MNKRDVVIKNLNLIEKGGKGMQENLMDREDFKKILALLKKSKGYFLGVTILSEAGMLNHYTVMNSFPKLDLLRSNAEIEKLIISDLKKPDNSIGDIDDTEL